jgi:protein SERAC1
MSEVEFNEKYIKLTRFQSRVLLRFLKGNSDAQIASELESTKENVRQHLSKICQIFDITDRKVEGRRLREGLITEFRKYKPELLGGKWINEPLVGAASALQNRELPTNFPFPGGALGVDSQLYIDRELIESGMKRSEADLKTAVMEPRTFIRIIAPSKFGKTSLLLRIEAHAKAQNFRTVYINIKQEFDRELLEDRSMFMRAFCDIVGDRLNYNAEIPWRDRQTPQMNCTRYIETLLDLAAEPLVLMLDGVEVLYTADTINQEFFQMLRRWHDRGASKEVWGRIRHVMVYSCDNYGTIDLARSPFNIGRHYELGELGEFNEASILDLSTKYQLNLSAERVAQLRALIGGHPYLVNLAFHHFATRNDLTIEHFLCNESEIDTIYQSYLGSLVNYLERNIELKLTLKKVIDPNLEILKLEDRFKHILYSMGLIKYLNSELKIRCQLYQQYFQKYFLLQSE